MLGIRSTMPGKWQSSSRNVDVCGSTSSCGAVVIQAVALRVDADDCDALAVNFDSCWSRSRKSAACSRSRSSAARGTDRGSRRRRGSRAPRKDRRSWARSEAEARLTPGMRDEVAGHAYDIGLSRGHPRNRALRRPVARETTLRPDGKSDRCPIRIQSERGREVPQRARRRRRVRNQPASTHP